MKIKRMEIYGYGKWVNQTFDVREDLQIFYGRNESGKSTLQSFIRSILFGFPDRRARRNKVNRYEPKHADVHGGRILFIDTPQGDLWVERTTTGLTITQKDGEVLTNPDQVLAQLLGGLDQKLFDSFYAFNLKNLQELATINSEELNDFFLSIGTVGSDKFIKLAKDLAKESEDLFKPRGSVPPLNQLLTDYQEQAQKLADTQSKMDTYNSLVRRRDEEESVIETLDKDSQKIQKELRELDKLQSRYNTYLEDLKLQREKDNLHYVEITTKTQKQVEEARQAQIASDSTVTQLIERKSQLQKEKNQLARLNWALEHKQDRKKWLHETSKAKEIQRNIEQLRQRIKDQKELMEKLALDGQFYPESIDQSASFEDSLEEGLKLQTDKEALESDRQMIDAQRQVYLDKRGENQEHSAELRQQSAKLINQRVNEEAQLEEATSFNHYMIGLVLLIVGVLGLTLGSNMIRMIGGLLVSVGMIAVWQVYARHKSFYQADPLKALDAEIARIHEEEIRYKENIHEYTLEINERDKTIQKLEEEIRKSNVQLKNWLTTIGFYPTADAQWVLQTNPVKQYLEAKDLLQEYMEDKEELTAQIDEWRELLQPLFQRFNPLEESVPYLLRFAEETEASLATEVIRGQGIQAQIHQAEETIKSHRKDAQDRLALLQGIYKQAHADDYSEFQQQLKVNQRIEDLNRQRKLYQEQLQGYEDQLLKVKNMQELVNWERQLKDELKEIQEKIQPHHQRLANVRLEIDHLQKDGSYEEQVQYLSVLKDQVIAGIKEWGEKRLASGLIYETLQKGIDNPLESMNKTANEIFEQLSFGRYTEIRLNKTGIKVRQFSDVLFDPHELSQGTLEQLYVALRLAFIMNTADMVKMPILIDDAFVNFDEFRKAGMYQVLEKIAKDFQVLFFTFDQQAKESFTDDKIINLEEITNHDDVKKNLSKEEDA